MDDIIKKKFGLQIRKLRKAGKYTQEQFAENININPRQMARIEAGESFVTSETIYKICSFLEIQPKTLFDFELDNKISANKNLEKVYKKILNFAEDSEKLEFIEIAADALTSKSSLEKLKLIVKGIELSRN